MSTQTLKPCPFCGSHGVEMTLHLESGEGGPPWRVVRCLQCNAIGPNMGINVPDDAVAKAWGTRTQTPDALFDPEAGGWELDTDQLRFKLWTNPGRSWFVVDYGGLWEIHDEIHRAWTGPGDGPYYSGAHPTTALVHEIIRLNGGDNE